MNKYAIYCDSLEDEQLLKDWIKKEFNSDFYKNNNFYKLKYYFHYPDINTGTGFVWGDHSTNSVQEDYTKINIKDFLKQYYMKELTELPSSWAVLCDGSQLFVDTVIKYLNDKFNKHLRGIDKNHYYGIDIKGDINEQYTLEKAQQFFGNILTLDQFIKLTTKNMKTQLLGLPVIKGEYYHLEAFKKDVEKLGYTFVIGQTPFATISHDNIGLEQVLLSHQNFTTLFLGTTNFQKNDTKEFNLPQDWSKCLDFMKENMDRWNKIQEENKEPEFKVGDIVIASIKEIQYIGELSKITPSLVYMINWQGFNYTGGDKYCTVGGFHKIQRKATPQEIEEYNNKPKIFKMTSTSGDFELEVSKKGIYYRPEDKWLDTNFLWEFTNEKGVLHVHLGKAYKVEVTKVNVGCKKDCLVSEFQDVYNYYKSITK